MGDEGLGPHLPSGISKYDEYSDVVVVVIGVEWATVMGYGTVKMPDSNSIPFGTKFAHFLPILIDEGGVDPDSNPAEFGIEGEQPFI